MPDLDYIDPDVGYLLGMLVARGEMLTTSADYRVIIHFPKALLGAQGLTPVSETEAEHGIQLSLHKVSERLREITGADDRIVDYSDHTDLMLTLTRRTIAYRDLEMLFGEAREHRSFQIPDIVMHAETPVEIKREFIRGFADVAGNIRPANRDQIGRHRVRLDVLNAKGTWKTPVNICQLLQTDLGVEVPVIAWGHPNMGRAWREHQINIYADDFLSVGFQFGNKQKALEELAEFNEASGLHKQKGCPGARKVGAKKKKDKGENDAERLPDPLLGKHFNAYWRICRALGCPRRPSPKQQAAPIPEEDEGGDA